MPRPEVSSEENIVRAIHSAHWDLELKRGSSQILKGQNISVSRLSILSLEILFEIFHTQLDTSPNGIIIGAGEINVGRLIEIGENFTNPIRLTVEENPLENNSAHAEIPQKISRSLAKKIIDGLLFHKDKNID